MRGLLRFMRENWFAWLLPFLILMSAIAFLAWKAGQTPDSPFIYDV